MQFSGNSLVPALDFGLTDLQDLLYVLVDKPSYEPYGPITFSIIMHAERASLNADTGYILSDTAPSGSVWQDDLSFLEPKISFSYEPLTITTVPLPGAIWLFSFGLFGFLKIKFF